MATLLFRWSSGVAIWTPRPSYIFTEFPSALQVIPSPRSHHETATHTFFLFYKPQSWIYKAEYLWYSFINPRTHIEDQNSHHLSLHGNLNMEKPSCRSQSVLWSWGCLLESSGKLWKIPMPGQQPRTNKQAPWWAGDSQLFFTIFRCVEYAGKSETMSKYWSSWILLHTK